ncbi:hypothetical protein CEXT_128441 [Caerostris extrusa]|uniref:Uncharacterized protein n=1 Tax=Caerostris extrusa TaxID=172846 RepID=A0AAV4SCH2_CAEEX|nr:hypothetical protein CEXT_128441 [Caerostris extrusa]
MTSEDRKYGLTVTKFQHIDSSRRKADSRSTTGEEAILFKRKETTKRKMIPMHTGSVIILFTALDADQSDWAVKKDLSSRIT